MSSKRDVRILQPPVLECGAAEGLLICGKRATGAPPKHNSPSMPPPEERRPAPR